MSIQDLELALRTFHSPMRAGSGGEVPGPLRGKEAIIFGNLEDIMVYQEQLQEYLQAQHIEEAIGGVKPRPGWQYCRTHPTKLRPLKHLDWSGDCTIESGCDLSDPKVQQVRGITADARPSQALNEDKIIFLK